MKHDHDEILFRLAGKKAAPAAAAPAVVPDFTGLWVNELGSKMDITMTGASIVGTYTSAVSGGGAQISGPLVGWANGDVISFTVNWPVPAITAWVGQLIEKGGVPQIFTLWQMSANVPDADEPTKLWTSINAGSDTFTRL